MDMGMDGEEGAGPSAMAWGLMSCNAFETWEGMAEDAAEAWVRHATARNAGAEMAARALVVGWGEVATYCAQGGDIALALSILAAIAGGLQSPQELGDGVVCEPPLGEFVAEPLACVQELAANGAFVPIVFPVPHRQVAGAGKGGQSNG